MKISLSVPRSESARSGNNLDYSQDTRILQITPEIKPNSHSSGVMRNIVQGREELIRRDVKLIAHCLNLERPPALRNGRQKTRNDDISSLAITVIPRFLLGIRHILCILRDTKSRLGYIMRDICATHESY